MPEMGQVDYDVHIFMCVFHYCPFKNKKKLKPQCVCACLNQIETTGTVTIIKVELCGESRPLDGHLYMPWVSSSTTDAFGGTNVTIIIPLISL